MSGAGDTVIGVLALMVARGRGPARRRCAWPTTRRASSSASSAPRSSHRDELAASLAEPSDQAMTLIVTGAAGFIGSNLVKALNARGERDIVAVDNLARADKVANLADLEIADFIDKRDFIAAHRGRRATTGKSAAVLHQGACSDTMETDGRYMMENNYRLLDRRSCAGARARRCRFIYASSASVVRRRARRSARRASTRRRSTSTATRSSSSTRWCARRASGRRRRRSRASATSTSTARAKRTRAAWPRSRATSSTSTWQNGQACSLFEGSGGYGRGEQLPRLRLGRGRRAREPVLPRPPAQSRASSTWARVARRASTTSRARRSTPCARARREGARRSTSLQAAGAIEYIAVSAAARGQVPELYAGRSSRRCARPATASPSSASRKASGVTSWRVRPRRYNRPEFFEVFQGEIDMKRRHLAAGCIARLRRARVRRGQHQHRHAGAARIAERDRPGEGQGHHRLSREERRASSPSRRSRT